MGNYNLDIKSKEKIAILDANNFYVSCERLFQPKLEKEATVVLSNNDGCIIARSQEVKDMGIKMGQPLFKLEQPKKRELTKFSSNYALYGDMSDRIANILKRFVPKVEIYSIDESFLDLSHIPEEKILDEIKLIKETIHRLTGIPVSIGVAPTKTLAKLCNRISKTNKTFGGVCSYWNIDKELISSLDVDEVWGIGEQYRKKLTNLGIKTVKDFMNLQTVQVKSLLHITGLRTWYELNEVLCHSIKTDFKTPKMITCSRSFGSTQWNPMQVKNAYWTFLQNCHKKLQKEKLAANRVNLFATTNRFDDNYFVWSKQVNLTEQTDDLEQIWNQIATHLEEMPIRLYYKAGLSFNQLKPNDVKQEKIFVETFEVAQKPDVRTQLWQTRRDFLSKEYTTNWNDLPLVF
jgi:DNA polymerase V